MIKAVCIARTSDAFVLCEFNDSMVDNYPDMRPKAKKLLQSDKTRFGDIDFIEIDSQTYANVLSQNGVTYVTICDAKYPKKLAKAFSVETAKLLEQKMQNEFGSTGVDIRSRLETIDQPYYFINFDKTIKRLIEKFKDAESSENMDRINSDLYDIQNAMTESFDLLLDKEKKIGEIYDRASKLKQDSKQFKDKAKEVRISLQLRQYLIFIVIAVVILIIIFIKFF